MFCEGLVHRKSFCIVQKAYLVRMIEINVVLIHKFFPFSKTLMHISIVVLHLYSFEWINCTKSAQVEENTSSYIIW